MKLDRNKELTPVLYGESGVKILGDSDFAEGLCFCLHWHERMEMLYVTRGELSVQVGNLNVTAPAESVVIIPPGRVHEGFAGKNGAKYFTVMFDIPPFFNRQPASEKYLKPLFLQQTDFLPLTSRPEIVGAVRSVIKEQLSGDRCASLAVTGGIYSLIALLYRYALSDTAPAYSGGNFREVTEYIGEHYRENISSASLSRRFGYDEAYFCRRFKSVTGLPPMTYIQMLRLEASRDAIRDGEKRISAVASMCGFSDAAYFSRCFKKRYGMTPTEYAGAIPEK